MLLTKLASINQQHLASINNQYHLLLLTEQKKPNVNFQNYPFASNLLVEEFF